MQMIEVGAFMSRQEAELAKAALAASGIASVLEADDAGGALGLGLGAGARLFVEERDAELAVSILAGADG